MAFSLAVSTSFFELSALAGVFGQQECSAFAISPHCPAISRQHCDSAAVILSGGARQASAGLLIQRISAATTAEAAHRCMLLTYATITK